MCTDNKAARVWHGNDITRRTRHGKTTPPETATARAAATQSVACSFDRLLLMVISIDFWCCMKSPVFLAM